ncbi:MAG: blue-copper protein [Gemmatimonadetes bacterium]|nr:blue-copper protein [Gemmatimonadota bacterium]
MRIHLAAGLAACVALSAAPAVRAARAPGPITHEVRMWSDGATAHFAPAEVVIHPGDAVRFVNTGGGPHNVSFDPEKLPADVRRALLADMGTQIQPLWGPLLTETGRDYTIRFSGVKPGRYEFFCMPHMAMGMRGVLVVR